jgi:hypothetical protein
VLRALLGERSLGEREELALPVVEVVDARRDRSDLFELPPAEGRQPVQLEVETNVVVQVVDADGEVEGRQGRSSSWRERWTISGFASRS